MKLRQLLSFRGRFLPQNFCSIKPRFYSRKFGPFLTMQFYTAIELGYNHAQREMIIRRIESFQIFKVLADLFADQNVPQEYRDHQKFLCDWLISTACRRQNIELVELAIEMGSSRASAVHALMVMQRRLPEKEQMEALELLRDGNKKCCAECMGGLAAFCAFNSAIDPKLRMRIVGPLHSQYMLACRSGLRGSLIGTAVVANLLISFANTFDERGIVVDTEREFLKFIFWITENEFLKSRFQDLIEETMKVMQRSDRQPYLYKGVMLKMAEALKNDISGSYLKALLRF